jgi:glutathionyl-hydroquinone reductase
VPVLWDKKLKTIVNNESSDIIRMFNSAFNDFAQKPALDLRSDDLTAEIDSINEWVYPGINNGVYRCVRVRVSPVVRTATFRVLSLLA